MSLDASDPGLASAVRTPRFCTTLGLMLTVPSSLPSSPYFGTSIMSMKGDLPGFSNFCCGNIGSYQYSTLRSGCGAAAGDPGDGVWERELPNQ